MSTKKISEIFVFAPRSNVKAGEGMDEGKFRFYTSSQVLSKFVNKTLYSDEALIFGTGGGPSVHYSNEPFTTSTDCIVAIRRNENFNTKFVYYYLLGNIQILERGFKGAGLKHISKAYIENIEIPLFDIENQNKIVALLDKVSSIVEARRQTIRLLEDLLKARFLEMFGTLIKDKTNHIPLGNCIKKGDKINYGIVQPGRNDPNGVPIVRIGDFSGTTIDQTNLLRVKPEISEKHKSSVLKGGELLLACVGGTIGKVVLVDHSCVGYNIVRATARIRCGDKIINSYLLNLLQTNHYQGLFQRLARTVAQPTLNIKQISELLIPIPSHELQKNFDSFYKGYLGLRNLLHASQITMINHFKAVLKNAYTGKIALNVSIALDALLKEIDLKKSENDLISIATNEQYLEELVARLSKQDFENQEMYDKAKHVAFQLLKNEERLSQTYDEDSSSLKLVVK